MSPKYFVIVSLTAFSVTSVATASPVKKKSAETLFMAAVENSDSDSLDQALASAPQIGLHRDEVGEAINTTRSIIQEGCTKLLKPDNTPYGNWANDCSDRARTFVLSHLRLLKEDPSMFFIGVIKNECDGEADNIPDSSLAKATCLNHSINVSKLPFAKAWAIGDNASCKLKSIPSDAKAANAGVDQVSAPNSPYFGRYMSYYGACVGVEVNSYYSAREKLLNQVHQARGVPGEPLAHSDSHSGIPD